MIFLPLLFVVLFAITLSLRLLGVQFSNWVVIIFGLLTVLPIVGIVIIEWYHRRK